VNGTLSVGVANQTITIVTGAPAGPLFPGDTFTVAATASSGLPVTYSASGACTNVGAVFTMNANSPGVCTVTYSQAGDSNYNPAPSLTETVDIALVVATNGIDSSGDTGDNVLAELEVATVGINQLIVTFNKDVYNPAGNTDPDDVTNPANYILVSDNGDGIQTTSCTTGITGGDVVIPVNSVVYTNGGGSGPFVATVNINGGVALPVGAYRFIVCGSTSVVDLNQIPLAGNNQATGTDFTRNFFVASASTLIPNTGFPQNEVTQIPQQPKDLAYTATDIWLEIPKLNVRMLIVGVPLGKNGWDVTWLGKNAGWLDGSAFPTWSGNSVITAHVWDANNKPGPFARLKDLRYGDQIIIRAYGQVFTYAVSESLLVSPTDTASMLKHSDKPMLTLITCEDYQDKSKKYSYRRMVRAMLVSVAKEK
jgi:LPXTG-site transpeptidase (sortase) family protein